MLFWIYVPILPIQLLDHAGSISQLSLLDLQASFIMKDVMPVCSFPSSAVGRAYNAFLFPVHLWSSRTAVHDDELDGPWP